MASAAEHLASSISFGNFDRRRPSSKKTAVVHDRRADSVPAAVVCARAGHRSRGAWTQLYETQSGGILDVFNTFSGGALSRFSIVALGVMPYITASIVVQLGATLYGPWQALRKEGETGRKKLQSIYPLPDLGHHPGAGLSRGKRP